MSNETSIQKSAPTPSERFTSMVIREFSAEMGGSIQLSEQQKRLAQHLFIRIDVALKAAENKRLDSGHNDKPPIVWQNVNMSKLAVDSMHRIELGLDALIPNQIHPIAYFNKRLGKYDLDLRIGYTGKDYYRRKVAMDEPVDIIYELVYSNDKFRPIKRSATNQVESYEFDIVNPFDRGEIIGGFGYLVYEDERKNRLIIVTEKDFQKSMSHAQSKDFWTKNPVEMRYKTIVNRVTDKLTIDPEKVGRAYAEVEAGEVGDNIRQEIVENANRGEVIDIQAEYVVPQVEAEAVKDMQGAKAGPGF